MVRKSTAFLVLALFAFTVLSLPLSTHVTLAAPPEGHTRGNSHSNPDGGGVDKPYDADGQAANTQGADAIAPDGNNGCGQEKKAGAVADPDFGIDDNNGNCGNKHNEVVSPPGED